MVVEKINVSKKQVYLKESQVKSVRNKKSYSNNNLETEAFQLKFFLEKKVGDKCFYKNHKEKLGHFFTIYKGFDGFLYDPKLNEKNYVSGKEYEMIVVSINKSKRQVTLKRKK